MILLSLLAACERACEKTVQDHGVTWVGLCEDSFAMGSDVGPEQQRPLHLVDVPAFAIAQTETTVDQYAACVDAGACTPYADEPEALPPACSWGRGGDLPMTCVTAEMAANFCAWAEARLPSEAEWEFAARSGGLNRPYPWGREKPTCELAASMECAPDGVWPVCQATGRTDQGLCDMAGNAFEWVADSYHKGYRGAPTDGSPDLRPSTFQSMRGGGVGSAALLTTRTRTFHPPDFFYSGMGFRCARDQPTR